MQILTEAHSYKTYDRAVVQVHMAIDNPKVNHPVHWFIIAQGDGRFTPCVRLDSETVHLMHYFIDQKCAVIN